MFRCVACQHQHYSQWLSQCRDYYLHKQVVVDYVRCQACDTVQAFPLPTDVSDYYDCYPVHQKKSFLHRFIGKVMNGMIYYRSNFFSDQMILLDFGCGNGDYLHSLHGKLRKRYGYEPSQNQALSLEKTIGCRVFSNLVDLESSLKNKVDVMTMHMVLEHVVDVKQIFIMARTLLKPGGSFYVVVPNAHSWEAKLFGAKWHGLDPPRHISFLSKKALEELANKNGMKLIKFHSVSFANSIAGSLTTLITGRFSILGLIIFAPISIVLSRLFPSGSQAYYFESSR